MSQRKLLEGLRRATASLAWLAAFALLAACSSKDERPLLLVNLSLAAYPTAATVTLAADAGSVPLAQRSASPNATGHYGLYLPAGTSGSVTVSVALLDGTGCVLAQGARVGVPVSPGEIAGPVEVSLTPGTDPCATPDAGLADTGPVAPEVGGLEGGAPSDVPPVEVTIGPDGGIDGGGDDGRGVDLSSPDGIPADAVSDTAAEGGVDVPLGPEAGPEIAPEAAPVDVAGAPDAVPDGAEAGPTTMNVGQTCQKYTHTEDNGSGTPKDYGVRQVAFSPDGKYLVSFGDDGRAKAWKVTATGLADLHLAFAGGNGNAVGSFSPDGKLLAVGHGYDCGVSIYDFPASVSAGAASLSTTLSDATAPDNANWAAKVQLTNDGNHVVVYYAGQSLISGTSGPGNSVAVWELTPTPTRVKLVAFPLAETSYAILPATYPGPTYVATVTTAQGDAGYQYTLALNDVFATPPTRVPAPASGEVNSIEFTPDGNALAVAYSVTGEIARWDITDKQVLAHLATPFVAATSGAQVYALAFSTDGKYLVGALDYSIKLVSLVPSPTSLVRSLADPPFSMAFAPDGLALAVGQLDLGNLLYCTP